jgi:hypothetical protein
MSIVAINTLKGYFLTGKKPTQQQFENLIDTLMASGITELTGNTASYEIAAGKMLDDIVILATTPDEFSGVSIGLTEGGNELVDNETVVEKAVFPIKHYCEVSKTIYFTGIDENATIKLYIK